MKIRLLTFLLPLTALTVLAAVQGPDAGGYSATDAAVFSFVDISGGGGTSILSGTDDGTVNVTMPFSFQFYGTGYTNVCVSSNGAAYLLSNPALCAGINDFANTDLSSGAPTVDQPALFPLWSDLTFQTAGAGSVFYQTLGAAGSRRFIIQWNNAYPQGSANPVTFQVILDEATNAVSFQYQTVTIGAGDPANNGGLATIGIRNSSAQTTGQQLQWAFGSGVLADSAVLTFTKGAGPLPPVLITPSNGDTAAANPVTLSWSTSVGATSYDVYFGTSNPPAFAANVAGTSYSPAGTLNSTAYNWQVVAKNGAGTAASAIWSFTTGAPVVNIPLPPPTPLSASPSSVTISAVALGSAGTKTVTISLTTSDSSPTFSTTSSVSQGSGWLSVSPQSGPMTQTSLAGLLSTYSATITIKADPAGINAGGTYFGNVNITAGGNTVSVPVTLNLSAPPAPQPTGGIANAASAGQAVASVVTPGSYIAIYGTALAGTGTPNATTLPLPTTLNGAKVTLCGVPVPLLYASATQINALLPQNLTNAATCPLVVTTNGVASAPVSLTVTPLQPGIYTVNLTGSGAGIVTNALTGALNDATHQARAGDFLVVYATGLGAVAGPNGEPGPADGAATPSTPLFRTKSTITATIGGVPAQVLFSGLTPTFAGLYQVNVQMPAGVTAGSAVNLVLTETDPQTKVSAQSNTVTIVVQ